MLTQHLLSLPTKPTYEAATQHAFLAEARDGTLPSSRLALWLSQDRIYAAHAYPKFIGSLISRIPFNPSDKIDGPEERMNQRILKILAYSLENVVREVSFFGDTAKEWGLQLDGWLERKGTRDYTAEMARVSQSLEDGLVFLWAMERVYFDAWSFVRKGLNDSALDEPEATTVGAVRKFSDNWSSPEFAAFVQDLADVVDDLGITPNSKAWSRAEQIWLRVVELEVGFWPEAGEEIALRAP